MPIFKGVFVNKLNLGCGLDTIDGWLNIDYFSSQDLPYGLTGLNGKKTLYCWDLTKDPGFEENSIKYIYSSHFIEHIDFTDAINMLDWCYKCLRPNGIIRITCPDISIDINHYVNRNEKYFKDYADKWFKSSEKYTPATMLQIFMASMSRWRHKWGYDFESLKDILERAGFKDIKKRDAFDSDIPDILSVEPHHKDRVDESLYIEAKK